MNAIFIPYKRVEIPHPGTIIYRINSGSERLQLEATAKEGEELQQNHTYFHPVYSKDRGPHPKSSLFIMKPAASITLEIINDRIFIARSAIISIWIKVSDYACTSAGHPMRYGPKSSDYVRLVNWVPVIKEGDRKEHIIRGPIRLASNVRLKAEDIGPLVDGLKFATTNNDWSTPIRIDSPLKEYEAEQFAHVRTKRPPIKMTDRNQRQRHAVLV